MMASDDGICLSRETIDSMPWVVVSNIKIVILETFKF